MRSNVIYVTESGEGMTEEDVLYLVENLYRYNPSYINWDIDEITGGVQEFLDKDAYFRIKNAITKLQN